MANLAYISVGTNMGNLEENVLKARAQLQLVSEIKLLRESIWLKTSPIEMASESWFLNLIWEIETDLTPQNLLLKLNQVEVAVGGIRQVKVAGKDGKKVHLPRIMDLDLLLFNDQIINEVPKLVVPHPQINERKFLLELLSELIPEAVHPQTKKTYKEILATGNFEGQITKKWTKENQAPACKLGPGNPVE